MELPAKGQREGKQPIVFNALDRKPPQNELGSKNFLDPAQYGVEVNSLRTAIENAAKAREGSKRFTFKTDQDRTAWTRLEEKLMKVPSQEEYLNSVFNAGSLKDTVFADKLKFCLSAVSQLLVFKYTQQLDALAQQNGFGEDFTQERQITVLDGAGPSLIKIAGLSIKDVDSDEEKKPRIPPSLGYRFLVEGRLVGTNFAHGRIANENKGLEKSTENPNLMKSNVQRASDQISAFPTIASTYKRFMEPLKKLLGPIGEFEAMTIRLFSSFDNLQNRIQATILNPQDPDFDNLKACVEQYLKGDDEYTKGLAVYPLGMNPKRKIPETYRKVRELSLRDDKNTPFYQLLSDAIVKFVYEMPSSLPVLTEDDLIMFVDKEGSKENPPAWRELRDVNGKTFGKYDKKSFYSVDPQSIDWKNVTPPQKVEVTFSAGGPGIFDIELYYENETNANEKCNLKLSFNARREEFDWPFLEAPNDPKVQYARDALFTATKSILLDVQRQAEKLAETRDREKNKPTASESQTAPSSPQKKTASESPRVPRIKEPKQHSTRNHSASPLETDIPSPSLPKKGFKQRIELSPNKTLQEFMDGIPSDYQHTIEDHLRRFNEEGLSRLKYLPILECHEIRVGKYRVKVKEIPANGHGSDRTQRFEIVEIEDRKDIFKRFKKKKNH